MTHEPPGDPVDQMPDPEEYVLCLYVAGQSPRSLAAIDNLKGCHTHLAGRYSIGVIDLQTKPQRARDDDIVAIPTLIRRLPPPLQRLIGDLSQTERELIGLTHRTAGCPGATGVIRSARRPAAGSRCGELRIDSRPEIGLDRAAELDDHGVSPAILGGGNFETHPTLGHVVFMDVVLLDAVEANSHVASEHLFAVEGAARINGEVIRRNVVDLILGHDDFR